MNCSEATYRISCELAKISASLSGPSVWEIFGVVISAFAAAGTLWIAALNLKLLRKEHHARKVAEEENLRAMRLQWMEDLLVEVVEILTDGSKQQALSKREYAEDKLARQKAIFTLYRIGDQHRFPNAGQLLTAITDLARDEKKASIKTINFVLRDWVEMPDTPVEELIERHS